MADAALRIQSYFRGYLSRGLYGALRRGAKAAAQDAANRETLRQWVEANVAKHGPQTRYQYTRKAADRLAASQRKRCTTKKSETSKFGTVPKIRSGPVYDSLDRKEKLIRN